MLSSGTPIPSICVTPATPEKDSPEPLSPILSARLDEEDEYRAKWLSVPPLANTSLWRSSPLCPVGRQTQRGVSRDKFDILLNVSRDQRARLAMQKLPDLRRELALKNQRLKQLERRALFLSKIKNPLHSVASETAHREVAVEDTACLDSSVNLGWKEQARGLLTAEQPLTPVLKSRRNSLSLDEITARLRSVPPKHDPCSLCTPDFPKASTWFSGPSDDQVKTTPVRSLAINDEKFDTAFVQHVIFSQHPPMHAHPPHPGNVVASTVCTSHAETARDMIMTLKRRGSPCLGHLEPTQTSIAVKRHSAPAVL